MRVVLATALAVVTGAGGFSVHAEAGAESVGVPPVERPSEAWHPSEAWVPYPSEPWTPAAERGGGSAGPLLVAPAIVPASPDQASSPWPRVAMERVEWDDGGEVRVPFGIPALEDGELPRGEVSGDSSGANYRVASEAIEPWCDERPHSHFLRSLGRFGLVAPHTPGVESSHSPYLLGPAPWGAPVCDAPLFAPPAPGFQGEAGGGELAHGITGEGGHGHNPCFDSRAQLAPYSSGDFTGDPFFEQFPYDACAEQGVYGDKYLNPTQRPLIEWGMPLYDTGPVPPPSLDCGPTNPSVPRFYLYGDYRAAIARNDQGGVDKGVLANRLNLEWDLWLTATERFHMFTGPFQDGNDFMRFEFADGDAEFFDELDLFDANTDTLFFEGDLGYMVGGWTGRYASFDMPVAVGLIPLLFQNGYWMEDAIVGAAMTIPARNSPMFDWSNYDVTFFVGFDQVTSPAFANSNSAAHVLGATTFIEAKGGYFELGYAFLDDTAAQDRSYHNVGLSYTRRYLNLVSNSVRAIGNAGQSGPVDERTANGVLLVAENSFLTPWPYHVIPYANLFVGIDAPQSVARAGAAGGILRNVGILFESDFLTGYPTLDATANETYGGALGIDLLAPGFKHQLMLEVATVQAYGNPQFRNAPGDQYGAGARYQVPISNATLLRFDAMYGWLEGADDISGVRAEYRWKF